ncbi:hypothetical protein RclHR1_03510001 [Rhizophagus clarus]|uniref:Uncharacterized protein n=1 Tax=Rhizophagus clarus TaxID=94130 RepID=A0A2Z6RAM4_9GLOM|nr:hypothetical protein RclHR1_03510001 [Rhizophagus clarus]
MRPQCSIVGEGSKGRIDYAIKEADELIRITENKQHKVHIGFVQNIKQLKGAYEKRKRKRVGDYFDYIYGIVTTGQDWHFLLYTPGNILKGSKSPHIIFFTDDALVEDFEEYQTLYKSE